jgi:hypothetical protein
MRGALASLVCALSMGTAVAAEIRWECTLDPASTYAQTTTVSVPLAGTWIGDRDPVLNPTGTTTLPGLLGGSGNNPIAFSSVVKPVVEVPSTHPAGGFTLWFDEASASVRMNFLLVDALAGQAGSLRSSMALTYATFRTTSPNSTFPAASNLSIPLEDGVLSVVEASQTAEVSAVATPAGEGLWDFSLAVPVQVRAAGSFSGDPLEHVALGTLALTGRIDLSQGSLRVTATGIVSETTVVPAPEPLVNAPFALPTVLPPGWTANLLMNATYADGTAVTAASAGLVASGRRICAIDLDINGVVDFGDVVLLLLDFGPCPGCASDVDGTGEVDFGDVVLLLLEFGPCGG